MWRKKFLVFISLILLFIITTNSVFKQYPSACDNYTKTKVKGEVSQEINKLLFDEINQISYDYMDITSLINDEKTDISYIYVNSNLINGIALNMSSKIYSIIENKTNKLGIPIGNLLGFRLLSGKGGKISFDVIPTGAITYELKNELISSGINQTLHRIKLIFKTEILCMYPFHQCAFDLCNEIIISELLIVGKIPEVIFQ